MVTLKDLLENAAGVVPRLLPVEQFFFGRKDRAIPVSVVVVMNVRALVPSVNFCFLMLESLFCRAFADERESLPWHF